MSFFGPHTSMVKMYNFFHNITSLSKKNSTQVVSYFFNTQIIFYKFLKVQNIRYLYMTLDFVKTKILEV